MPDTEPTPAKARTKKHPSFNQTLTRALIREQRISRYWGIFFKAVTLTYIIALTLTLLPNDHASSSGDGHTAVIEINGMILSSHTANATDIVHALEEAYADPYTNGIVLRVNSPGGGVTQSAIIYENILRLKEKNPDIPIHTVIEDIGASGAYWIAAATDNIYANSTSIVGSIGVIVRGFGLDELLNNYGVERRIVASGKNKNLYDPFLPENADEKKQIQKLVDNLYAQFIDAVQTGRGDRLESDDPEIFSGLIWSGQDALDKGLIDGLSDVKTVARDVIGAEELVVFKVKKPFFDNLINALSNNSVNAFHAILNTQNALPQ